MEAAYPIVCITSMQYVSRSAYNLVINKACKVIIQKFSIFKDHQSHMKLHFYKHMCTSMVTT